MENGFESELIENFLVHYHYKGKVRDRTKEYNFDLRYSPTGLKLETSVPGTYVYRKDRGW